MNGISHVPSFVTEIYIFIYTFLVYATNFSSISTSCIDKSLYDYSNKNIWTTEFNRTKKQMLSGKYHMKINIKAHNEKQEKLQTAQCQIHVQPS
jgi:hypothetical protein